MLGTDPAVLQQLAESGDCGAQLELGKLRLAQERFEQAAIWFKKAAEQEDREAQCLYGSLLSEGLGVDQDYEAAAYWLLRAAQQGHSGAQVLLAQTFESGHGVPANRAAAAQWYQKAAEQGDSLAQCRYGQLLLKGEGVPQDLAEAARNLRAAAEADCPQALAPLVECLEQAPTPDAQQILHWAGKAAEQDTPEGHYLLASMIEKYGQGARIEEAVEHYRQAAEHGVSEAQLRLGKLYAEGKIVAKNPGEAERWLSMVVDGGEKAVMTESKKMASIAPFMSVNEYPPGSIIDNKYFIMSVLGKGGMCMVYKAKHLLMNKMVALKMLLPESAADPGLVERFKREAQAASSLNHPNVITIYDLGVSPDGKPFMVMDYLEGESLEERLQSSGRLQLDQFLRVFSQVCAGLETAHEMSIVHRDIKPSNIMLINTKAQTDHVKVVDFGLAKMLSEEQHKLTKSGEVFGTLLYMSPEQCLGHPLDPRTDIYSVGCAMYEAISGYAPFSGGSPFDLMNKHINVAPTPIRERAPEVTVPPVVEAVIFKALAKNREERFQTMTELREALRIPDSVVTKFRAHIAGLFRPDEQSP